MSTTATAVRQARAQARTHPHYFLALKAAMAAMLAWLVVQPLGGFAAEYAYYPPLGALSVVSTSVVRSARNATEVVVAILLGAALALAAQALPVPEPIPLGLAVVAGVLVGASGLAGNMGSWVPLAAMFVLIAGRGDPIEYTAAYGGLTAVGALVGVGVYLVFPQLPLTPAVLAQDRLREQLADQLDELAEALVQEILNELDWNALRRSLERTARDADALMDEARDARRANWKAARWAETTDHHDARAQALQRLTGCVDEVIALVAGQQAEIRRDGSTATGLRATTAEALERVAALLRDRAEPETARAAVSDLRESVVRAQATTGAHHFAAAAIVLNLEQAVEAWA
ncbi:hypothetical protein [Nocardioides sp. T2.26MG-1]|uniref:hypothetical protein n=1 Tax=Nocardioides sp. T2.26MG-1 TaxID=3041166 RepID=UPI00247797D2|nr:hypothetical protein [Nocardioides sp. T2.26MG-1]CAI9416216.1 hypothetical protein HIDPHFAB_02718 [Nocardioides sp. T2.26MG-1]